MRKCAVLSLLAHALLACFATTVQIVVTAEPQGTRPAVHVALVSGEVGSREESIAEHEVQPWEGLQAGPLARPELPELERPKDDVAELAAPDSLEDGSEVAPFSLPEPEPTPDPQAADAQQSTKHESILEPAPVEMPAREAAQPSEYERDLPSSVPARWERNDQGTTEPLQLEALEGAWHDDPAKPADAPKQNVQLPPLDETLVAATEAILVTPDDPLPAEATDATPLAPPTDSTAVDVRGQSADAAIGLSQAATQRSSVFRNRDPHARSRLVQEHGGSEETEAAVERALQWLSRAQSADGRWDAERHGAGRELAVLGHDRQGAGVRADTGVTGLALLTFLGAGHTHHEGKYQREVQSGLAFLIRAQGRDGNLAGDATLYARMYCHAMAAFALSEAYAMTGDPDLEDAVRRGVAYTVATQHAGGGWRYRAGDPGDTSQLGWQLMALRSAEMAGVEIPEGTWQRAEAFLRGVSRGRAGGLAAYQATTGVSRPMSAEATYCKLLLAERSGQFGGLALTSKETAEYLRLELPGTSARPNFYYWYYATLLLHLRQKDGASAEKDWHVWNEALKQALLPRQHRAGPSAGAWGSDTMWGGYGGRVFTTALAALCLETYYRYLPLPGVDGPRERAAARPGLLHQRAFDTRGGPDRIR